MYPILRLAWHMLNSRIQGPMGIDETGIVHSHVGLLDIDVYSELNNGRTLTLLDLGRICFLQRIGLISAIRREGWSFAVAGGSLRFRHRIPFASRIKITTRLLGHDGRWFYFQHLIYCRKKPCFHALIRGAVTSKDGIVPVDDVLVKLNEPGWNRELPDWANAWIDADAELPWPPD